jgi:hypothetical protein
MFSRRIDKPKQVKLQWLQNPIQMNGDNMNNVWVKLLENSSSKKGISERQN